MKLPPEDLNPDPYLPHPTSTYIYAVTIAPRVSSNKFSFLRYIIIQSLFYSVYVILNSCNRVEMLKMCMSFECHDLKWLRIFVLCM